MTLSIFAALAVLAVLLLYHYRPYWAWVIPGAAAIGWWGYTSGLDAPAPALRVVAVAFLIAALLFGFRPLRRIVLTSWLIKLVKPLLPRMGETERVALEAGTVWWDGDLFSGNPDWRKLLDFKIQPLSDKERAFLDGPVEDVCAMLKEWDVVQRGDLSDEVWQFLKRHGFFGMIIPEYLGGLGFSAAALSAVIVKLASRSITASVTVMVPNSLGPAELILHYGTDEQKKRYLPRLASGEEIPCFALTGPEAGSDAAATQSEGIVCRGTFRGEEVLGMRLNWRKRYITLS